MAQLLLIPDPRPLDERLGQEFFREAPQRAGVYLMRDAADRVLYVGKAGNLRQRLRNYRTANPDRMPRRHLRLVREVARIDFEFCPGETAALRRESKLLRALKPRFNRAGVWPRKIKFLVRRQLAEKLELAIAEVPAPGWRRFGPLAAASQLYPALARMLWLAVNPSRTFAGLPAGWTQGRLPQPAMIHCGDSAQKITGALDTFFWGAPGGFLNWLNSQFSGRTNLFERVAIDSDLETLQDFAAKQHQPKKSKLQLALI